MSNKNRQTIEAIRQASEIRIQEQLSNDNARIATLDQEINEINNELRKKRMALMAENEIKMNDDKQRITNKRNEIEQSRVGLEKALWDVEY